jgi:hypothetical protein
MSFNPSSFTSTQNAGVKPKIVVGDAGYMTTAADGANWTTVAPSATPFTVTEGQSAVVVYHFVNPTTNALTELMDTATVNIKWAGASAADVSGQLQYLLYSPTTGWAANFQNVLPSGNVSFTDALTTDPTVGTGVSAIAFRLAVVKDTLAENGEHINFQLTQSSATKFTDSFYVEAKVDIVDAVNTVTNNSVVGVLSGSANADSFVVNPGLQFGMVLRHSKRSVPLQVLKLLLLFHLALLWAQVTRSKLTWPPTACCRWLILAL